MGLHNAAGIRARQHWRPGHCSTGGGASGSGAGRIFTERASGGRWDRPELHRMLDQVRAGDVVVVWKLDRLSRSLRDLLHLMDQLEAAKAGFRSLTEAIDTTSAAGRMMMQVVGAFAQFERDMIRERTRAGLAAAAAQGRKGGRRPKLSREQRAMVVHLVGTGEKTASDAARLFGVNPSTVSRLLADARHRGENLLADARHRGEDLRL